MKDHYDFSKGVKRPEPRAAVKFTAQRRADEMGSSERKQYYRVLYSQGTVTMAEMSDLQRGYENREAIKRRLSMTTWEKFWARVFG